MQGFLAMEKMESHIDAHFEYCKQAGKHWLEWTCVNYAMCLMFSQTMPGKYVSIFWRCLWILSRADELAALKQHAHEVNCTMCLIVFK